MTKVNLLPADTYIVANRTIINDHDRKLLTMLYQPIVGSYAVNLYFTLWSYLDKAEILSNVWSHHQLLRNMGLSISELLTAREKLEGIGLLKVYIKEDNVNNYIYELFSPVSAHDFFANPILSTMLYSTAGNGEYETIKDYFRIPKMNYTNYENITSSFSDVYTVNKYIDTNSENIRKKNINNIEINYTIDVDNLLNTIPEEMLEYKKVNKDTKDLILKLSFVYNLTDDQIVEIVKSSINEVHGIDKEKLRTNFKNYFQFEHNGKMPSLIYNTQPENLRSNIDDTSTKSKAKYQFETTSPFNFLSGKYKDSTPTKAELSLLEYLLVDLNLKPGVVNVLIDYVLRINNNKLTRAFVETIAAQWKKSKIETVEDAMALAKKEDQNKKKIGTKYNNKKVEEKPDWFDKKIDYVQDDAKKQELEQILKEFR